MNDKKTKLILSIILGFILCLGGIFAYIFVKTDFMKSNYDLFNKYYNKNKKEFISILDQKYFEDYLKNIKYKKYKHNTIINASLKTDDEEITNKLFEVNGKYDGMNNNIEQDIVLNYSDRDNFKFKVIKNSNKYAVGSDEVVNLLIGVKNENIEDLQEKLGLPQKEVSLNKKVLKKEEIKSLNNKYLNIIKKLLNKNNYIIDKDKKEYILSIKGEQLENICTQIANELKEEEIIINLLEEQDYDKYKKQIDNIIELIDFNNAEFQYIVSKKGKDSLIYKCKEEYIEVQIENKGNNNIIISILGNLEKNNFETNYDNNLLDKSNIDFEEQNKIDISINYKKNVEKNNFKNSLRIRNKDIEYFILFNLEDIDKKDSKQKIIFEMTENKNKTYKFELNSDVEDLDEIEILKLNKDNCYFLNDASKEEIEELLPQILDQLKKVNVEKLNSALKDIDKGYDDVNIFVKSYYELLNEAQKAKDKFKIATINDKIATQVLYFNIQLKMEDNLNQDICEMFTKQLIDEKIINDFSDVEKVESHYIITTKEGIKFILKINEEKKEISVKLEEKFYEMIKNMNNNIEL